MKISWSYFDTFLLIFCNILLKEAARLRCTCAWFTVNKLDAGTEFRRGVELKRFPNTFSVSVTGPFLFALPAVDRPLDILRFRMSSRLEGLSCRRIRIREVHVLIALAGKDFRRSERLSPIQ